MDGLLRPGLRVQVLPGRNFPSFSAGDAGVVHRIDDEARTCDILFDQRSFAGPTPVAMRHLGLASESASFALEGRSTMQRSSAFVESVFERNSQDWADDLKETSQQAIVMSGHGAWHRPDSAGHGGSEVTHHLSRLESQLVSQQSAWAALERRVSACESTVAVGEPVSRSGQPAGRIVAARIAGIESSHQAEVAELRDSLREAVDMCNEHEQLQRQIKMSTRDFNNQSEAVEERCGLLQKTTRELESQLEKLSGMMSSHERRAVDLKEVVAGAGSGLTNLGSLLEGQERRTSELGQALSAAEEDLAHLNGGLEEATRRRRHLDPLHDETESNDFLALRTLAIESRPAIPDSNEKDKLWHALRELQELVVHESENRAAGLREVLGVLDHGIGQLRTDQARLRSDLEGLCKAESRKIKQHTSEVQSRFFEVDQSATRLDERLEDLTNSLSQERNTRAEAVVWLTGQLREVFSGRQPQSSMILPSADAATPAAAMDVLALKDSKKFHAASTTEDTLGKLRGQLEGLRCELQGSAGPAEAREQMALANKASIDHLLRSRDSIEIPLLSPSLRKEPAERRSMSLTSLWKEPIERQSRLCHNCGNTNQPDAVFCRFCGVVLEAGASFQTLSPRRVVHTISEATQSLQPRVIYDSMNFGARPTVVAPSQGCPSGPMTRIHSAQRSLSPEHLATSPRATSIEKLEPRPASPCFENGLDISAGKAQQQAMKTEQSAESKMAAPMHGTRITLHTGRARGYSRPSEYQAWDPEDNEDTS